MSVADGLPSPQRGKAVLVIVLGIAMSVMDGSIVNLALPGIAREMNAPASQAIWVVNAYQIASLVMLLPLAALGDRLGYRRVYLVGMALFVVSSVAAMLANSLAMLTAARALQGLGAAGIMSVNTALVRLIYPADATPPQVLTLLPLVAPAGASAPAAAVPPRPERRRDRQNQRGVRNPCQRSVENTTMEFRFALGSKWYRVQVRQLNHQ